jgi:hypothetical protein
MKVLSIRAPYADQILFGWKRTETRTWPPPAWLVNGRLAIHESGPSGRGILGEVTVLGAVKSGRYWQWLLSEPTMFDKPIRCRGFLGIWNYRPQQ